MAKVFRSIEEALIQYTLLKKNQYKRSFSNRVFYWGDIFKMEDFQFVIRVEFDNEGIFGGNDVLSIHPAIIKNYSRYYLDVLLFKINDNKIQNAYMASVDYCDRSDLDLDGELFQKSKPFQDLEDFISYLGMILGMGYPEIKEFEKQIRLLNLSIV